MKMNDRYYIWKKNLTRMCGVITHYYHKPQKKNILWKNNHILGCFHTSWITSWNLSGGMGHLKHITENGILLEYEI